MSGQTLEQTLRSDHSEIWVVSSPNAAPLRAAAMVSDQLESRGYKVNGWLINRSPSLLCESLPPDAIEMTSSLMNKQLSGASELHALTLSVIQQELDRARDAELLLRPYQAERLIYLISERLDQRSPLGIVESISRELAEIKASLSH